MTANQKYKSSGTTKPFKQWLIDEQSKGSLEVKPEFQNATGEDKTKDIIKQSNNRTRNVLIAVGVSIAIYGIYKMSKNKG